MATCTLTGTILLGDETPYEGAYIHAIPYETPSRIQSTENVIVPQPITRITTSTGEFSIDLVRNVRFTIKIPAIGFNKTIRVPDQATEVLWSLTDIFVSGDTTPTDEGEDDW